MKCPHCKEGDTRFGYDFKNQAMLNTHIKHKHKDVSDNKTEEVITKQTENDNKTDPEESQGEPTRGDFGLDQQEKQPIGECSECGADVFKGDKSCRNCNHLIAFPNTKGD